MFDKYSSLNHKYVYTLLLTVEVEKITKEFNIASIRRLSPKRQSLVFEAKGVYEAAPMGGTHPCRLRKPLLLWVANECIEIAKTR